MSHVKFYAVRSIRSAARITGATVNFVTSRRACRFYRAAFRYTVRALGWAVVAVLAMATVCYLAGYAARDGWNRFESWADEFVAACQSPAVVPVLALAPAAAPVALLPAAPVEAIAEVDPWDLPAPRVLVTPAPAPVPALLALSTLPLLPPAKEVVKPAKSAKKGSKKPAQPATQTGKKRGRPRKAAVA